MVFVEMFSKDQKLDLRNVCDFSGGAYRFEFICPTINFTKAVPI
jgi:hypothetical protein